jgi:hypothetical protein
MRFYRSYNALIPRLQSGAGLKNIGVLTEMEKPQVPTLSPESVNSAQNSTLFSKYFKQSRCYHKLAVSGLRTPALSLTFDQFSISFQRIFYRQ